MLLATAAVVVIWLIDAWMQMATVYGIAGAAECERDAGIFGADHLKLGPVLATLSPFLLLAARARWGRIGLMLAFLLVVGPIRCIANGLAQEPFPLLKSCRYRRFCTLPAPCERHAGGY